MTSSPFMRWPPSLRFLNRGVILKYVAVEPIDRERPKHSRSKEAGEKEAARNLPKYKIKSQEENFEIGQEHEASPVSKCCS